MKKLLIILFITPNILFAQNIGFNGSGFFENYNTEVEQYLKDMHQPFVLRVPGGAISKFHDPYNVKKGWGMSEENIKSWFEKTGFDEDGNGLDKWLRKAEEQPNHSYLDDLIALQKTFPDMQVLYVLNVVNSTPEKNMQAIRYLMQNNVKVVGVEAGNEVYGKYSSFSEYANDFEPIFKMISKEYPQIKKSLVAGANLNRKELVKWNDDIANYKGDYEAVSIHYYYTQNQLGEAYNMIPLKGEEYNDSKINSKLNDAFKKADELLMTKKMFEDGIDYAKKEFPGKEIWVTEWNTKPASILNNTIVNGAWQFKTFVENRNQVQYLIMHNGVSPDIYGMITRNNKSDSDESDMVRRMGYWSYVLASEAGNAIQLKKDGKNYLQLNDSNEAKYYFTNMDDTYSAQFDYGDYKVEAATIHYVNGKYLYSSSGIAGYMDKDTKPNYEVNGIKIETFTGIIPKYSYGYILIRVKK